MKKTGFTPGLAIITVVVAVGVSLAVSACSKSSPAKSDSGTTIATNRTNYTPVNDVEGRNYNARQALADNPATLIWCSAFPTSPNVKAFTVPIVGKLTSGNKRPYATTQVIIDNDTGGRTYSQEVAGPDGMFGTSGEYRYGFDPAGNYHDFYGIEVYCTSVPDIIQKQQTVIVVKDGDAGNLSDLDNRVQQALAVCVAKAGKDEHGASKYDPSKPCPEAARLLGAS